MASLKLYDIVKEGKFAVRVLVTDWIELYDKDNHAGLTELVRFIVRSCGCKAELQSGVLTQDHGIVQCIQELTQGFDEDSDEYPLTMSGPLFKRFRSNFSDFVNKLIISCQKGPLYDELLIPNLLEWLIGLSDSQVRAFRHTCTLASLKVVTGLASIAKECRETLDKTQRQLEAERKKISTKISADRIKNLERSIKEQEQRLSDLEEAMNMLFSSVFVHRYKDIFSDIRSLCISELGIWMREYSSFFLSDNYLKYIGWTLYDKVGEVRLRAIEALHFLYEIKEFIPVLQLFTDRFRNRLVSMVMDKDDTVAVQSVKVCKLLLEEELLDTCETEYVCSLVFVENRAVAQAATEFLLAKLFNHDEFQNSIEDLDTVQSAQIHIRELLMFYMAYGILEHGVYFVDALWGHTDLLKEWSVMTDMLLDATELSQAEENFLIELLTCSAIRAAGASPPPGRVYKKLVLAKEKKQITSDKEMMTSHLIQKLPVLMNKFSAEKDKTISLISLAKSFDLQVYVKRRLESHYEELLECLERVIMQHNDDSLLSQAVSTLKYLTDNDLAIKKTGEIVRNNLIDAIVTRYLELFSNQDYSFLLDAESDIGFEFSVISVRMKLFNQYFNLTGWNFLTPMMNTIGYANTNKIYTSTVGNILSSSFIYMNWLILSLDKNNPSKDVMRTVSQKSKELSAHLEEFQINGDDEIKVTSFLITVDILSLLSPSISNHMPHLSPLIISPSPYLQQMCTDFVLSYVFTVEATNPIPITQEGATESSQVESEMNEVKTDEEKSLAKIERTQKKREVFAAFTRLILYGSFPMETACRIFVNYLNFYDQFGSMMKLFISKCKEASQIMWSKTVLKGFQYLFEEILKESRPGKIDKSSPKWTHLREIAKRFNLLTGFELHKIRKIITALHLGGIEYSLKRSQTSTDPGNSIDETNFDNFKSGDIPALYPNLDFLEIISEFSHKLMEEDRVREKGVLAFLMKLLPDAYKKKPKSKGWGVLLFFVQALQKPKDSKTKTPNVVNEDTTLNNTNNITNVDNNNANTTTTNDNSNKNNVNNDEDHTSEDEDDDDDDDSFEFATSTARKSRKRPPASSTRRSARRTGKISGRGRSKTNITNNVSIATPIRSPLGESRSRRKAATPPVNVTSSGEDSVSIASPPANPTPTSDAATLQETATETFETPNSPDPISLIDITPAPPTQDIDWIDSIDTDIQMPSSKLEISRKIRSNTRKRSSGEPQGSVDSETPIFSATTATSTSTTQRNKRRQLSSPTSEPDASQSSES